MGARCGWFTRRQRRTATVHALRYVDVNEDDKREVIAAVFGSPIPVMQAMCKQELELEEGVV